MCACVILSKPELEDLPNAFFIKNKLKLQANNWIWSYRVVNYICLFIYLFVCLFAFIYLLTNSLTHSLTHSLTN